MQLSQQISGVSFLSLCRRYCLDFHYWKGIEVLTQQVSINDGEGEVLLSPYLMRLFMRCKQRSIKKKLHTVVTVPD